MSLILFIMLFIVINSQLAEERKEHFISDCVPQTITPMSVNDCIINSNINEENSQCCFATGQEYLESTNICVKVVNYKSVESRIEKVKQLNQIATGVYLDCGNTKEFKSTCGVDSPSSISQCTKSKTNNKDTECCYVKIKSERFKGTSCMEFPHMDINTIGEAIDAAKTIDVTLEVKCNSTFINLGYFMILIILYSFL